MILANLVDCTVGMEDADFWVIRLGPNKGKPTDRYNKKYLGVKVNKPDILFPKYAYYLLLNLFEQGIWNNTIDKNEPFKHIHLNYVHFVEDQNKKK